MSYLLEIYPATAQPVPGSMATLAGGPLDEKPIVSVEYYDLDQLLALTRHGMSHHDIALFAIEYSEHESELSRGLGQTAFVCGEHLYRIQGDFDLD